MPLIAHLSDPHLGPLPTPRLRELVGKRLTGYVNWRRGRRTAHDMAVLEAIIGDIRSQHPDHIAFTGDVSNIGLPAEFPMARAFLETLGPPEQVSFVPGNHDAYVRGSVAPMGLALGPWMANDGESEQSFPFLRQRDGIAIVGLSSAVPTLPFLASGKLGKQQIAHAEEMLAAMRDEGLCRVVLIHHPPYPMGAKAGRGLTDAKNFVAMIARVGAEIILHGHNHRVSLVNLNGPDGPVPVLGAPSASAWTGTRTHRAGYHLIDILPDGMRSRLTIRTRGLMSDGRVIGEWPPVIPGGHAGGLA